MNDILTFLEGLIDAIISIFYYLASFLDKLIDFMVSCVTFLPRVFSESGDTFKLLGDMFYALPDKIWFYMLSCLIISTIVFFIWQTRD